MFTTYISEQFGKFKETLRFFEENPQSLIGIERFVMNEVLHFIDLHLPEIVRDYNAKHHIFTHSGKIIHH